MIDDEFEWDDEKTTSNAAKHGVTFEQACSVFRDPFAIELLDDREDYNEACLYGCYPHPLNVGCAHSPE
jgi:uncharacterized protein